MMRQHQWRWLSVGKSASIEIKTAREWPVYAPSGAAAGLGGPGLLRAGVVIWVAW